MFLGKLWKNNIMEKSQGGQTDPSVFLVLKSMND